MGEKIIKKIQSGDQEICAIKGKAEGESRELIGSSNDYFFGIVEEAILSRKIETSPIVTKYISDLLTHYVTADNLFAESASGKKTQQTLAELYLRAGNAVDNRERIELLKRTGDQALYISGFFGDSLNRKIVDIDYYVNMGCSAYDTLAKAIREVSFTMVYKEIAKKFVQFMDALSYISQKVMPQQRDNLLMLFSKSATVCSSLAQEGLAERGLLTVPTTGIYRRDQ